MKEMTIEEAKKWIKEGGVRKVGLYYAKPIEIVEDELGRPWIKVKTWLIHPESRHICNAEGIGYIPLF